MANSSFDRAQAQYDAQEPSEGVRRCTCGCDWDDHLESLSEVIAQDTTVVADKLKEANEAMEKKDWSKAWAIISGLLSVCNGCGECRGFEPVSGDDYPEED